MNKQDIKEIHSDSSWLNRKTSWSINPERVPGTPYKVNKDSLSHDDRLKINAVKDHLTYGDDIDDDPLFQ